MPNQDIIETEKVVRKPIQLLRTQTEEEVLKCARRYARMALFRVRIHEGNDPQGSGIVVHLCKSDADTQEKHLAGCLLEVAKQLLLSMSVDEIEGKLQE